MSAVALPPGEGAGRVTLPRVVRSEWTKLRSLRSTWWVLLIAVALSLGLAAAIAAAASSPPSPDRGGPPPNALADPVSLVLAGTGLASLVFGVLGVLSVTGEYTTGSMAASAMAVPRRWPLVVAKAVVLVALVAPVALAACAGAVALGRLVLGDAATIAWDGATWRAVVGDAGYLTALALLGLGIGLLVRSSAGAITVLVAIVFVVPIILTFISVDWVQALARALPGTAGQVLAATAPGVLSTERAALQLVVWAVVPLVLGTAALLRRDA